jgi:signal transduction histidine kinase
MSYQSVQFCWLAGLIAWLSGVDGAAQLRTALEVRSLEAAKAETGQPVDLVGVAIFADPPGTIFLQDDTAGTFFRLEGRTPPMPGDAVRVRGKTFPGLYLTGIEECTFEVLEHRGLPKPRSATFDDLISGRFHYQRVAVEGIVRSIVPDEEDASVVRVAVGTQVIEVRVQEPPSEKTLVDSRVRISGLAAGHINSRRQLVDPYLRCSGWADVESLSPAPDEAGVPVVSTEQLLTFDIAGQGGHRIRISGVVLAVFPEGRLFIRDEASAVGVRLQLPDGSVQVGDRIEVVGFPTMAKFSASVVDATLSQREPGLLPPPVATKMADLLDGERDGELVAIEATLTDSYRSPAGLVLVLQDDEASLQAQVTSLSGPLESGSRLAVTGICRVESTRDAKYSARPESVSLRLRSGRDVVLLHAPDWWTPERLTLGSMILLVALVLGGLWIALLKRQVTQQTDALRGQIENEAALEERQYIAREFHDTLEQELAGLSLRLDAAAARDGDEKLAGFIKGSRSLVTRIQTETRNLVSDLREAPGQSGNIATALQELAAGHPDEVTPTVRCETSEKITELPSHAVHHLKRIAQEAITNAIKHAGADSVILQVEIADDGLALSIADDGAGFDTTAGTRGTPGHFGCMGIRERCRKIGATVEWESEAGKGTRVRVKMPIPT